MPVNFFKLDNIRTHSSSLKFIRFIPLKMINSTGLVKRQQNLGKDAIFDNMSLKIELMSGNWMSSAEQKILF